MLADFVAYKQPCKSPIVVYLTEQPMNQIFEIEIFAYLNCVFYALLTAKLACPCFPCITSYIKNKTEHRPTFIPNALLYTNLLKNIQDDSCTVLSNRH